MIVIMISFGKWLRDKRKAIKMSQVTLAELATARGAALTAGYISNLERDYYKTQDGLPTQPKEKIVIAIAQSLNASTDEALLAARYAPANATRKPQTIPELIAALESLGIAAPQSYINVLDPDGEGFREIIERIWLDIQLVTNRLSKGHQRLIIRDVVISDKLDNALEDDDGPSIRQFKTG